MHLSQLSEDNLNDLGGRGHTYDRLHQEKEREQERQRREQERDKEKADRQHEKAEAEQKRQRDERQARMEKRIKLMPKSQPVSAPSQCFPCPVCAARVGWQQRWRKLARPIPRV